MATPLRRQKPNSHRADGARDRIVAAALKALVEGDGEFEIGDVARRAKVSVGLAYHYFGSKAGLIAVLITDFHNRHEAVVNQSFDKSLPWPVREKARLKVNIDFLYSDPVAPVMMGKLGGSAEVTAIDSGRRAAMVEMAAENISQGQRHGFIAADIDAKIAAAAIIGGINQAVAQAIALRKRPAADRLTAQLWNFIAGGLSLEQATPQRTTRPSRRAREPVRSSQPA